MLIAVEGVRSKESINLHFDRRGNYDFLVIKSTFIAARTLWCTLLLASYEGAVEFFKT